MKNLVLVGLLAAASANGKELFRYEDEETGQVHYMSSLPEGAVEGGWKFHAPEGEDFEVTYKAAKETGFVPHAYHLPAMPDDTPAVTEAKQKFMAFYNNLPVDNYLPVAPQDTPEVQEAREAFLTFYKNMEQMALAEAEDYRQKEAAEQVVDDVIVELERRRRAPAEEVLEDFDDQLAVEARTADMETVVSSSPAAKEKLAHFKSLTTPYYTYPSGYKSAEKMPFKYHPYFNFYRQHFQDKTEDGEAEVAAEVEKAPETVPFHPYHPYFHTQYYHSPYFHYNPYFYYNYHHKKPSEEPAKQEEEPAYPETDFYPFYMAKPTEDEIKEQQEKVKEYEEKLKQEFEEYEAKAKDHQEKMKEYEETVKKEIEEYEAKRKEIMDEYADKMKAATDEMELPAHPFNTLEESAEGPEGEGKTISLPVLYNSYFPRWRYTHFKKPAETDMKAESNEEKEVKEVMSKRSAEQVFSAPATYLPTAVHVTKTVVKPLAPAHAPAAEEVQEFKPELTASQPVITYPQFLPVLTRVRYPVMIQYPTLVYPATYAAEGATAAGEVSAAVGVEEVKNANVPASTTLLKTVPLKQAAAAPLPENVFPIFPKTDGHIEEQAALAL